MSEMIERVARVLYEDEIGAGFDETYNERKTRFLDRARRVVAAMREPTDEMRDAGRAELRNNRTEAAIYCAMIDEVLG